MSSRRKWQWKWPKEFGFREVAQHLMGMWPVELMLLLGRSSVWIVLNCNYFHRDKMCIDHRCHYNSLCHFQPFPMHMSARKRQRHDRWWHMNQWYFCNTPNIDSPILLMHLELDILRMYCHIGHIFADFPETHSYCKHPSRLQYTIYTWFCCANTHCIPVSLKCSHVHYSRCFYPII